MIPRAVGVKMTELSESYSRQLMKLIKEAEIMRKTGVNLYGTEIEGGFAKSKKLAERFELAINSIEILYQNLRKESHKVMMGLWNNTDKEELSRENFIKIYEKYGGKIESDSKNLKGVCFKKKPPILLPLLKGKDVYANSYAALKTMVHVVAKENQSAERLNKATTLSEKTTIEMLYQVQPKHDMSVFSDHAGFVCKYEFEEKPPLYIYYHSLEHGQQHTDRRAAWNYGAESYLWLPVQSISKKSAEVERRTIQEPRLAYVGNLRVQLSYLSELAGDKGVILIIIGECTSSIDKRVCEFLKDLTGESGMWSKAKNEETRPNVKNENLAHFKDYDYVRINASKAKESGGRSSGLGVHALVGYILRKEICEGDVKVTAKLVTLKNVKQNFISVVAGGGAGREKHAFTHLLNGEENELAKELDRCGYVSVGGDLNNLTCGKEIVETWDWKERKVSIGSNSTGTKMYDKISIIEGISTGGEVVRQNRRGMKRRRSKTGGKAVLDACLFPDYKKTKRGVKSAS